MAMNAEDTYDMVLSSAVRLPGVRINRADFLGKELSNHFSKEVVEKAIAHCPAHAGISVDQLEKIAKGCIDFEVNKVTLISAATGIPGGFAMLGTVPADTAQYFAHIIRVLQKLSYLYGWEDFTDLEGNMSEETKTQLTLFIGVMFGVEAASKALATIVKTAAIQVEKNLIKAALTKGTIYPIVKQIAKAIGVKMTKEIFAKSVGKAIPILGAITSGGLTYITFKPLALRLKKHLKELPIANVNTYRAS